MTRPSRACQLPPLVFGTSQVDRLERDDALRLLDAAVELGFTAFDTAPVYGDGGAESILGEWLRSRGVRDRVILVGKGCHPDENGSRVNPAALASDLERSLDRLGTDHLDVLLLHRDDEDVPVGEIVTALDEHVRAGRLGAPGASNWSVARIRAANELARTSGRVPLAISSPQFSLAVPRTPPWPGCVTLAGHGRAGDRDFYAGSGVSVLAWSPLAAGFLLGEGGPDADAYESQANRARRERLVDLARARGASPAELALAYVLSAGFPVSAAVRCSTRAHLEECRRALDQELSPGERAFLEGPRLSAAPARGARARRYDAIVIGSGATGGWAAKELSEAGMEVLVVEAGPERDPALASRAPGPPFFAARQPVQSLHPEYSSFPPELFVDDHEEPYTTPAGMPFAWIRGRQLGGRTLTWGGLALRLSDFELRPRDGAGPEWPLAYAELAPWYDRVEAFHGVRGNADGLPQLPDGVYLPPAPMTGPERRLKALIEARWPDRRLIHARAVVDDRIDPETHWPLHTSPGSTLAAARRTGRLTLLTDAVARRLRWNRASARVDAVEVVDRTTGRVEEVRGRVVLLCASTIETTRLLLHSADADWPEGLGNASGVLGRYLMDHPVTMAIGWAEEAGDAQPSPFGGAHSVCIPRFRNLGRQELAAPRGYGIWGGVQRGLDPAESGAVPVLFIVQGEMLPNRENRVELDPDARDPWGVPAARITCAIGEQEELLLRDGLGFLDELGDAFGIEYGEGSGQLRPPGLFVHEMGTARMGSDRRSSFLDPWNRSWEIPNLFVCDGASFPASGWQNPTLTMMALTARCCDHIVQLGRRLEL